MMRAYLTKRNILWALALAITLWLTWQTHQEEQNQAENISTNSSNDAQQLLPNKSSSSSLPPISTAVEDFSLVSRDTSVANITNLFATPKKVAEINAKLTTNKPIKPSAPPLPFAFVGMVQEQGVSKLIVNYSDDVAILKIGDILGGYQLTSANKIGGSMQFQFLYLPMKITQTMVVNDAN